MPVTPLGGGESTEPLLSLLYTNWLGGKGVPCYCWVTGDWKSRMFTSSPPKPWWGVELKLPSVRDESPGSLLGLLWYHSCGSTRKFHYSLDSAPNEPLLWKSRLITQFFLVWMAVGPQFWLWCLAVVHWLWSKVFSLLAAPLSFGLRVQIFLVTFSYGHQRFWDVDFFSSKPGIHKAKEAQGTHQCDNPRALSSLFRLFSSNFCNLLMFVLYLIF